MALFKSIPTNFGGGVNSNYHRVENPAIVGKDQISFELVSFFIDPSPGGIEPMVKAVHACPYEIESQLNPFEQAYSYVKTLTAFDGAADC